MSVYNVDADTDADADADAAADDDDDDSWYDRMAKHSCGSDSDNEELSPVKMLGFVNEELDETSYYEALVNNDALENKIFAPENHATWDLFKKSIIDMLLVPRENYDIVEECLFRLIPITSCLLGMLYDEYRTTSVFIDDDTNPSLIIITQSIEPIGEKNYASKASFISIDEDIESIQQIGHFLEGCGYDKVIFTGISRSSSAMLNDFFVRTNRYSMNEVEESSAQLLYCLTCSYPSQKSPPVGYFLSQIRDTDVELIYNTWSDRSFESIETLRLLIKEYPSVGVYKNSSHESIGTDANSLVCWSLTYGCGAIGIVYTMMDHRRRGLAEVALNSVLSKWQQKQVLYRWRFAPYVYITEVNEKCRNLFQKIGFEKHHDVYSGTCTKY